MLEFRQMSIKDRIEKVLIQKGLTKAELADLSGVKRTTIYSCFQRNTELQLDTLRLVAKTLDVSLDYLVYGEENEKTNIQMLYDNLNETNQLALLSYAEGLTIGQYGYIPVHTDKPPIELSKK